MAVRASLRRLLREVEVKEPRHQLLAHLLSIGGIVNGADLYPALTNAPGQLSRVGLAVAAEEAGDGFAADTDSKNHHSSRTRRRPA